MPVLIDYWQREQIVFIKYFGDAIETLVRYAEAVGKRLVVSLADA